MGGGMADFPVCISGFLLGMGSSGVLVRGPCLDLQAEMYEYALWYLLVPGGQPVTAVEPGDRRLGDIV